MMIAIVIILSLLVAILLAGYYKLYRKNKKLARQLHDSYVAWRDLFAQKEEDLREHLAHERTMQMLADANRALSKQIIEHNEQLSSTLNKIKTIQNNYN